MLKIVLEKVLLEVFPSRLKLTCRALRREWVKAIVCKYDTVCRMLFQRPLILSRRTKFMHIKLVKAMANMVMKEERLVISHENGRRMESWQGLLDQKVA